MWFQVESFEGYSFSKAHSRAYADLSFRQAYIKARWPEIFLCAVLNNEGGYYGPQKYIDDAKMLGVRVLPIDVNESRFEYTVPAAGTIRTGFLKLKELSADGMRALLAARDAEGPFATFDDLVRRSALAPNDLWILAEAGACDALGAAEGKARPQMLWRLKMLLAGAHAPGRSFGREAAREPELPFQLDMFERELAHIPDYTPAEKCEIELSRFGFMTSTNILENVDRKALGAVRSCDVAAHVGRRIRVVGWLVASRHTTTKKGELMRFLNLDDEFGSIHVVVFPRTYRAVAHRIRGRGPFLVTGEVLSNHDAISVSALDVEMLEVNATSTPVTSRVA
jgi:DNA polymerase III alpha subunit